MLRLTLLFLALALPAIAQEMPVPVVDGFITAIASATNFDVDGKQVVLDAHTVYRIRQGDTIIETPAAERTLYVGEHLQIFAREDYGKHLFHATRLLIIPVAPTLVNAHGIVSATYPAGTAYPDFSLRAAGYRVVVPSKANVSFVPPLTAASPLEPNLWVGFRGRLQPDGTILAEKVLWAQNLITDDDKKLVKKTDYDPAAVEPDAGQTPWNKHFLGIDPKLIPPYVDPARQERITAIGQKLIPGYQRQLAATDPTRINFRFQLVDESFWHEPLTLPSGIILVPFQLVDRMQNDSQLAALLANSIAMALEKQAGDTRQSVAQLLLTTGLVGASALGDPAFVSGLVVGATMVAPGPTIQTRSQRVQEEERLRASLFLLQDADFDIYEAPHAWWLANSKKKDIDQIAITSRAKYLYRVLGTSWHKPAE